jgi:hypothetical protein
LNDASYLVLGGSVPPGALTTVAGTLTALKEGTQMCTLAEMMENVAKINVRKL